MNFDKKKATEICAFLSKGAKLNDEQLDYIIELMKEMKEEDGDNTIFDNIVSKLKSDKKAEHLSEEESFWLYETLDWAENELFDGLEKHSSSN